MIAGLLNTFLGRPSAIYVSGGVPPTNPALAAILTGGDTSAGVQVTEWTALNFSAVWAAVHLVSTSIAMLPARLYRRTGPHTREPATDHPVYHLLERNTSRHSLPFAWKQSRQGQAMTWGNCYAHIERDGAGRPLPGGLTPIGAHRVTVQQDGKGVYYEVYDGQGGSKAFSSDEILHVPGLGYDGVVGYSVIQMARESLGLTGAVERQGQAYFGNSAVPQGLLISKTAIQKEKRDELRESWERQHKGPQNRGRLALLWGDLDYKQLGLPPDDSQYLQTRQFQTVEVARWFNVPPHMIQDLTRSTYNNIEHQGIEFVTFSLGGWIVPWEQEYERKLLTEAEREDHFIEHDTDRLTRGDAQAVAAARQIKRQNGVISADEWRAMEGMNPTEDGSGKVYLVNGNMIRADQAGAVPEVQSPAPAAGEAAAPPVPEVIDLPDIRQEQPWTCGCAATRAVLESFGAQGELATEADYAAALGTTERSGTEPPAIAALCNRQGLLVTSGPMEIEDLAGFCGRGWPVIVPLQMYGTPDQQAADEAGHYVTVIGVMGGVVIFADPARAPYGGRRVLTEAEFVAVWHDAGEDAPDGAPVAYRQFGIAVGAELDAADDTADAEDAEDANAEPARPPAAKDQTQARAAYIEVFGRVCRREAQAARRAAKAPATWTANTEALASDRRLFPSCGQAVADVHYARLRAELWGLGERCTARTLAEATEAWALRWERERPLELAEAVLAFNEDQPRDKDSKFGEGGGGKQEKDKGGSKKDKGAAPRVPQEKLSEKAQRAKDAHHMVDKTIQRYSEETLSDGLSSGDEE